MENRRRSWALRSENIGIARAPYHLDRCCLLNMFPVYQPAVMIGNPAERFDTPGNLTNETTNDFIRKLLRSRVDWTRWLTQSREK